MKSEPQSKTIRFTNDETYTIFFGTAEGFVQDKDGNELCRYGARPSFQDLYWWLCGHVSRGKKGRRPETRNKPPAHGRADVIVGDKYRLDCFSRKSTEKQLAAYEELLYGMVVRNQHEEFMVGGSKKIRLDNFVDTVEVLQK